MTLSRGSVLHPTLPVDRVTRRKIRMAQDSDDPLFVVNIVVWLLVVILVIVALHCPLPCRVVRWCTIWCNKYIISLLGLIFVSHLSHLFRGDASFCLHISTSTICPFGFGEQDPKQQLIWNLVSPCIPLSLVEKAIKLIGSTNFAETTLSIYGYQI